MKRIARCAAVFCAALSSLSAAAARADVKIVSETTVGGMPAQAAAAAPGLDRPITSTLYQKGEKQRTETGSTVTIYDCAADKLYTLDPALKTYTVASPSASLSAAFSNPAAAPMLDSLTFSAKVYSKPTTEEKIIAGKPAKKFIYTAHIKMGIKGGDPAMAAMLPTVTLKGEQWTTDAVTLPTTCQRLAQNSMFSRMPPMMRGGMKQLSDEIAKIKGTPLSSKITLSFVLSEAARSASGGMIPTEPITTTINVTSVSEEPLDDALFTVPEGYKMIETPAAPGAPTVAPAIIPGEQQ